MSITYFDKIKVALEAIEEAVDKKSGKSLKESDSDDYESPDTRPGDANWKPTGKAGVDRFVKSKGFGDEQTGLHQTTTTAIKTLMQSLAKILKTGTTEDVDIKTQTNDVMWALKTEKARGDIKKKYDKELEELEKETAKKVAPSKSGGTAKVEKPAKAAEKKEGEPKEEGKVTKSIIKESFEIEGREIGKYIGKKFKWKSGRFTYVIKKTDFSTITGTPSSELKSFEATGYQNTIFQFMAKDTITLRKWRTQPAEKINVFLIKVVSGPDPKGKGSYKIGIKGMNKFSVIEIIEENKKTMKINKPEEKRDPKAAEKNQKSKEEFDKNKKTFEDPTKKSN